MKRNLFLTMCGVVMTMSICAQSLPYQNASLSAQQRADDLLSRLTLEEKVHRIPHHDGYGRLMG